LITLLKRHVSLLPLDHDFESKIAKRPGSTGSSSALSLRPRRGC